MEQFITEASNAFFELVALVDENKHWIIGSVVVFGLIFLFTMREVLGWYLKINQIRSELKQTRLQIQQLETTLQTLLKSQAPLSQSTTTPEPLTAPQAPVAARLQAPIDNVASKASQTPEVSLAAVTSPVAESSSRFAIRS